MYVSMEIMPGEIRPDQLDENEYAVFQGILVQRQDADLIVVGRFDYWGGVCTNLNSTKLRVRRFKLGSVIKVGDCNVENS